LQANLCWSADAPPTEQTIRITAVSSETGASLNASAAVSYAAEAASPAAFSVKPSGIAISAGESAALALNFATGAPSWSARVFPANRTSEWLSISPALGTGAAVINLQAAAGTLPKGVYRAWIAIEAAGALPQVINVPVTMTIGTAGGMTIAGAVNNASGSQSFAPGMQAAVYGTGLAFSNRSASSTPLPLTLVGVSATVNGVTAPLYYISPGQINLQIPYETGAGTAVLAIQNSGQVTSLELPIAAAAPGVFGGLFNNNTGNYNSGQTGDVITLFFTGAGDVTPTVATGAAPAANPVAGILPKPRLPLSVSVGGQPANVLFAGIPTGLVGVLQVNVTIPAALPAGPQPVVVSVGGVDSPAVSLSIEAR
jgi:uncharacterized protein (TIGR03437 family)